MNGRSACFQKAATRSLRRCVGLSLARAKGSNPVWPLAHTGLIYEDDGSALFGAVFLVSATASAARPLAGEVQSLEQPPHALNSRIPLAADLLDELADARERPQIGGISSHQGAGFECDNQPLLLSVGQSRRAPRARCLAQGAPAVRIKRLFPPPHRMCGSLGAAAPPPPAWHHAAVNAPPLNVALPVLHDLASCS